MSTESILKDVDLACNVVDPNRSYYDAYKIYSCSNEDLPSLFQNFSVEGKDVFTVLSSTDQYFYSCYYGARSVDCFDVNPLTEYYYYIRFWFLKYYASYYPQSSFLNNIRVLYELLERVHCENQGEEDAYFFWKDYGKNINSFYHRNLFHNGHNDALLPCDKLLECLKDKEFSFICEDIVGEVNKDKKYDVIILSNALEYYSEFFLSGDRSDLKENRDKLIHCRDNLMDLLKDDGIVVCSHIINDKNPMEEGIFKEKFKKEEFPATRGSSMFGQYYSSVGYSYVKKKEVLTKNG